MNVFQMEQPYWSAWSLGQYFTIITSIILFTVCPSPLMEGQLLHTCTQRFLSTQYDLMHESLLFHVPLIFYRKFVITKKNVALMYDVPGKNREFNAFALEKSYYGPFDETTCIDWTDDSKCVKYFFSIFFPLMYECRLTAVILLECDLYFLSFISVR